MAAVLDKPSFWQRISPIFRGFDGPLALAILLLAGAGLMTMYSVGFDHGTRFTSHGRNMMLAAGVLFLVSQVPPQRLMALAVPMYLLGVMLLLGVELFGITCLLLTFSGMIILYAVPFFLSSYELHEVSAAPGGLPYRWFLKSFIVTAFVLLALAGLSRLTRVWVALFSAR